MSHSSRAAKMIYIHGLHWHRLPNLFTLFMLLTLLFTATLSLPHLSHAQELFEISGDQGDSSPQVVAVSHQGSEKALFPSLAMLAQYRGEEKKGVKYYSELERQNYRVFYCGQLLCDLQGVPLNSGVKPPSTRPSTFPKLEEGLNQRAVGLGIYVMDDRGELWVSFEAKPRVLHHSSLLAGAPVSAAGEMLIFNGVLYGINNYSGHYQPPPIVIERVLSILKSHEIPTTGLLIKRFGSDF